MVYKQPLIVTEMQIATVLQCHEQRIDRATTRERAGLSHRGFDRARQVLRERGLIGKHWPQTNRASVRKPVRKAKSQMSVVRPNTDPTRWNEPPEYKTVFNLICHPQLRSTT